MLQLTSKKAKDNLGNYRSVSLTSAHAKTMEQVLLEAISGHMKKVTKSMPEVLDCFP